MTEEIQPQQPRGFGKPVNPDKPNPPRKGRRRTPRIADEDFKARKTFDQAEKEGKPTFEIFVRSAGSSEEWKAAGVIAVASNLVERAIYDSEEKLRQTALRQFPTLRKSKVPLEYGFRRKEFSDDPVKLAVRPKPTLVERVRSFVEKSLGKNKPNQGKKK